MNEEYIEIVGSLGQPAEITAAVTGQTNIEAEVDQPAEIAVEVVASGPRGHDGRDGVSPALTVTEITGGHRVDITDAGGIDSFNVMDGVDGQDGQDGTDGVSPTVSVTNITGGHRVSVTDAGGTETFDVMDGQDGQDGVDGEDGADGVSPEVTIASVTGGHSVTITDTDHPGGQTFNVLDGADGQDGVDGQDGQDGAAATIAVGTVSSLPAGSTPTVVNSGSSSAAVFDFGIPKGDAGADGTDGTDGADGISPTVSVAVITGGHRVTITDENGDHTFDVMNGLDGQGAVDSVNGYTGAVVLTASDVGALPSSTTIPTKVSDLTNDSGFISGLYLASYGSSLYADVLAAFQANKIVYCRASSNANPGTGNQNRMAFLAYVNDPTTPTEFEFQYYRSVSSHSDSQQGDQVFVYKLNSSTGWSVTTREAYTKIVASTGLSSSYSSGKLTLTNAHTKVSDLTNDSGFVDATGAAAAAPVQSVNGATGTVVLDASDVGALPDDTAIPAAATATPEDLGTAAVGSSAKYAKEDHVHNMPSASDVGAVATSALLDLVYPVGSLYWSSVSTDPGTLFGGTWTRVKDTFILAAGDTYTAGSTGGAATHTLTVSEMPSHNHGKITLTGSTPIRNAGTNGGSGIVGTGSGIVDSSEHYSSQWNGPAQLLANNPHYPKVIKVDASHTHTSNGGGTAHNNMPPYKVYYCWERTA